LESSFDGLLDGFCCGAEPGPPSCGWKRPSGGTEGEAKGKISEEREVKGNQAKDRSEGVEGIKPESITLWVTQTGKPDFPSD
jgi:hypothetical protein